MTLQEFFGSIISLSLTYGLEKASTEGFSCIGIEFHDLLALLRLIDTNNEALVHLSNEYKDIIPPTFYSRGITVIIDDNDLWNRLKNLSYAQLLKLNGVATIKALCKLFNRLLNDMIDFVSEKSAGIRLGKSIYKVLTSADALSACIYTLTRTLLFHGMYIDLNNEISRSILSFVFGYLLAKSVRPLDTTPEYSYESSQV